jgi:hypothetical protein
MLSRQYKADHLKNISVAKSTLFVGYVAPASLVERLQTAQ